MLSSNMGCCILVAVRQFFTSGWPNNQFHVSQGEPLRRYFYGLYSQADLSAFEANMYLAEDRVLCLEIVARKNGKYK